jgi:hypothetical protein
MSEIQKLNKNKGRTGPKRARRLVNQRPGMGKRQSNTVWDSGNGEQENVFNRASAA